MTQRPLSVTFRGLLKSVCLIFCVSFFCVGGGGVPIVKLDKEKLSVCLSYISEDMFSPAAEKVSSSKVPLVA